jgi:hypothetical protein
VKSLEVAGMGDRLTPEGKGDLISLLRFFLRMVIEYESEDVIKKYSSDIETTCIHQLGGEEIWSQLEKVANTLFEKHKKVLLEAHPIADV